MAKRYFYIFRYPGDTQRQMYLKSNELKFALDDYKPMSYETYKTHEDMQKGNHKYYDLKNYLITIGYNNIEKFLIDNNITEKNNKYVIKIGE